MAEKTTQMNFRLPEVFAEQWYEFNARHGYDRNLARPYAFLTWMLSPESVRRAAAELYYEFETGKAIDLPQWSARLATITSGLSQDEQQLLEAYRKLPAKMKPGALEDMKEAAGKHHRQGEAGGKRGI